ncbi:MAG TPA: twin-arginine translocase TatA/TatE family subunit [Herpetosiphonaceae bacterium]
MFGTLGPFELLVILAIVIAIFGAGKLAGIGGALGGSIREFRRSVRDDEPVKTVDRTDEPRDTTRV